MPSLSKPPAQTPGFPGGGVHLEGSGQGGLLAQAPQFCFGIGLGFWDTLG